MSIDTTNNRAARNLWDSDNPDFVLDIDGSHGEDGFPTNFDQADEETDFVTLSPRSHYNALSTFNQTRVLTPNRNKTNSISKKLFKLYVSAGLRSQVNQLFQDPSALRQFNLDMYDVTDQFELDMEDEALVHRFALRSIRFCIPTRTRRPCVPEIVNNRLR